MLRIGGLVSYAGARNARASGIDPRRQASQAAVAATGAVNIEEGSNTMTVRVAINGFGRIGRAVLRASLERDDIVIAAVNDLTDAKTLAHLLKYDSVHGQLGVPVRAGEGEIHVGDRAIRVLAEPKLEKLPWGELDCPIVIESTGAFTKRADAAKHLDAGARKVIISAPATSPDATLALGVNDDTYDPAKHHVVSNASCTTNCLAPIAKVLHAEYGIVRGWMTTTHAYTNDQRILDLPHSDLRRARAAALSMIPTTTGAAKAVGLVLPELAGKLDGFAMRVPTADVSVVDLVAEVARATDAAAINEAFRKAAAGPMAGILAVCDEPLVSIDFVGNPHSSIVDSANTKVMGGTLVKVLAWYDNEWAYATRTAELAALIAKSL
jgi:glyceraldehyde 3-phosphate dehydrogenase